jgi:ABC-2 type transport system permease protein
MKSVNFIAFQTIAIKESVRFIRIWPQTLLPSVITMTLYYLIFGNLIGKRIGDMGGYSYIQFIVPGLVMLSVITNSYTNVVASFFSAKFQRYIDELIVSPTSSITILLGYVSGGMLRGILVGIMVILVSVFFTRLHIEHPLLTFSVIVLTAMLFALAGMLNGIFARKFDDVSIIPTFVLTPLTYLGGVFYSISLLPPFWRTLSRLNPILYMVNAFRFGMLGTSDIEIKLALAIILLLIGVLFFSNLYLLKKGTGIRT